MKEVIKKLENRISTTPGLTVLEKYDDDFAYSVALQKDGDIYLLLTSEGIYHTQKEDCLVFMKVREHIPFNLVTPTKSGDFIRPYTLEIRDKKTCIGKHLYGLTVDELPIFQ